jgi:hypothetical protein
MAKVNWTNGGGDFVFSNPLNWSTGRVLGRSDIANINAAGTYTVFTLLLDNETFLAITTIPTATLDVTNNSALEALAGTGTGTNAGTIIVEDNSRFVVGGTVKNSGIISLNSNGGPSAAILGIERDTTLQGGGKIILSGGAASQIADYSPTSSTTATLTNVDNVISGTGVISVRLVNQKNGVINANGNSSLEILNGVTNAGLLESTTGGLGLSGAINNSASGVIGSFGASSPGVGISGGTLSGGTLKTTGGGQISISHETIDGSNGHTVTNTGSLLVDGVTLLGTINNTGTITLNGGTIAVGAGGATVNNTGTIALNDAVIPVGAGGLTLAGSGSVAFNDSSANIIAGTGTSTTLTNQTTISGAGDIGGNGLLLTNQGVIDATAAVNPLTGHLIANNNGTAIFAGAVSGTGTATVYGAGSIEFGSTTTSNITFAAGADGTVTFDAASTLTGKLSVTGFTLGDTIDLADIKYGSSGPSLTFSKGVLTVSDGTDVAKLTMVGNYTLASFHAAPDGSGGTLITDPPVGGGSSPPTSPPGLDHVVALFTQSMAGFSDQHGNGVMNTNPLSQIVTNQEQFLANPHHG